MLRVDDAASPCIGVCQMDADDHYCTGCLRTRDEIARWSMLGIAQRQMLNARLAERRAQLDGADRSAGESSWSD